ncbi:hypothetical protein SCP_0704490 [Sparassis crispa]|uniref:Uncharacterized protein n=1 Tax=Sparassis crispa TaxID=139825 RepID=A0A401GSR0_9APHY|nr:hypothetical protein SCP_0704490 [Sparassis crispa]GBE85262.1 hypothetical protein SCP_0704490 [Sparassis crispa]
MQCTPHDLLPAPRRSRDTQHHAPRGEDESRRVLCITMSDDEHSPLLTMHDADFWRHLQPPVHAPPRRRTQMFGGTFVFGGRRAPLGQLKKDFSYPYNTVLTFSSSSLHQPLQCDDAAPAPHSHTLLPPRSLILLRPPRSHEEPTRGQPGNTAWLREVDGPTLSPRPRTPLALHLSVLRPSRSCEEPTRRLREDTVWLREVDGPALAPPLRTPLALRPSVLQPSRSRKEPTRGLRGDTARLREVDGVQGADTWTMTRHRVAARGRWPGPRTAASHSPRPSPLCPPAFSFAQGADTWTARRHCVAA